MTQWCTILPITSFWLSYDKSIVQAQIQWAILFKHHSYYSLSCFSFHPDDFVLQQHQFDFSLACFPFSLIFNIRTCNFAAVQITEQAKLTSTLYSLCWQRFSPDRFWLRAYYSHFLHNLYFLLSRALSRNTATLSHKYKSCTHVESLRQKEQKQWPLGVQSRECINDNRYDTN